MKHFDPHFRYGEMVMLGARDARIDKYAITVESGFLACIFPRNLIEVG